MRLPKHWSTPTPQLYLVAFLSDQDRFFTLKRSYNFLHNVCAISISIRLSISHEQTMKPVMHSPILWSVQLHHNRCPQHLSYWLCSPILYSKQIFLPEQGQKLHHPISHPSRNFFCLLLYDTCKLYPYLTTRTTPSAKILSNPGWQG